MTTFKKTPAQLAIQRSMVITDGLFFNVVAGKADLDPVLVFEHGIRGTQNTTKEKSEVANIQRTESAKLDAQAEELCVSFELRCADLAHGLAMCAEGGEAGKTLAADFRASVKSFVERARTSGALQTLCKRYARNVLNGRWLWRNRSYAETVRIEVYQYLADGSTTLLTSVDNALKVPTQHFDDVTREETLVGDVLAQGLMGEPLSTLLVKAFVNFGVHGSVEVYPSQNYVERQRGFARSLFKLPLRGAQGQTDLGSGATVVGHAALRDQKIGNALRSIDTWYKDFSNRRVVAPVEPVGASLETADFLRKKPESAFELMKQLNVIEPTSDNGQYMLAILIRGGVFGESAEKEAAPKAGDTAAKGEDAVDGEGK